MRRGPWHQCGDKSQKLVQEQLENGTGVGAIISPRDLSLANAIEYAQAYHGLGAEVLVDPQFYIPGFSNTKLDSYPGTQYRVSVSQLHQLSDQELSGFAAALESASAQIGVDAVVAPAVLYQAGRTEIIDLNLRLHEMARWVGSRLGKPVYASVVLGRSVTSSDQTLATVVSQVTSLAADGWYYGFEFETERLPSSRDSVRRSLSAGLTLACTGKPVLHAYAGPLALLSLGWGATAAAIGHSQNLWRFTPERWEPATGGGGGAAPPRFFSTTLWGTIISPDELARLRAAHRAAVLTHSPYSQELAASPPQPWARWKANKHLVHMISTVVAQLASVNDPRIIAQQAIDRLDSAVALHGAIAGSGIALADQTNAYQANWRNAMADVLGNSSQDYDYLNLLP